MSDPYGSYDNPYGVRPPYPPHPHEEPQPASWQEPPPPPGLYPPPVYATGLRSPTERRPGPVTTAAVLTFVLCGLTILLLLIAIVGVVGAHVDPGPDPDDALTRGDMVIGLIMIGAALLATVTAVGMAGLALARRQGPRITLVVLAIAYSLVLAGTAVAMIVDGARPATSGGEVAGGVAVLLLALLSALCALLLLLPSAGRWYAGRPR